MDPVLLSVLKIFIPATVAFFLGILITPSISHFLYKNEMWKKKARNEALGGGATPIFNALHKEKEVNTPRMGGLIIWISVLLTSSLFWIISLLSNDDFSQKMDFVSRSQTWLPFFILIVSSLVGLLDDYLVIKGRGGYIAGGIPLKLRIAYVIFAGLVSGWWFFEKLDVSSIAIPFYGDIVLGAFFIPVFVLVMLALFSGGVIDGIDGLSGGIFATIFAAYGTIAFFQNQIDLAAFCMVVVGGLLAFLWFNIPPARFYMTETGILGLTTALAIVAFLTEQVAVLPIIALPLFVSAGSVILQLMSKKLRNGKKIFLVAPIHHHFEAVGWPSYKVTMRFWILSIVFALLGMIIALIG